MSPARSYPAWKAPAEDGQVLIWPGARELLDEALENQKRLSSATGTLVQNVPLPELRRRARAWINLDDGRPLIGDAHQTELHHAGVWVKRVLAYQAASRVGGSAVHFAVDTDAPKHLTLRWLGGAEPITDDPDSGSAHWCGLVDAPTPAHLSKLEGELKSQVGDFLVSLRRLALEQPNLSSALTNAMHEMDWSLGLRHHALLVSPMLGSEAFLIFAHHVISRAGEFASAYNRALAEYRRQRKVRTKTRPMPDLVAFAESVETPFWLDDLAGGRRTRPSAFAREGGFVLTAPGGEEFDFDRGAEGFEAAGRLAQWLRRNQLRLSPRALTLTLFLRLFVVDQFIHGIGGGQYDQVTDRLIASHFKIEPPRFAVTTGTMYLPQALGRSRVCVPCVAAEGHGLRHSVLGEQKRKLVAEIEAAPRRSPQRYAAFVAMHRELASAAKDHPAIRKWEQRLREAQASEAAESLLFDRELFYGLQPRPRLEEMIACFARAFE